MKTKLLTILTISLLIGSCGKDEGIEGVEKGKCNDAVVSSYNVMAEACDGVDDENVDSLYVCDAAIESFRNEFPTVNCESFFIDNGEAFQIKNSDISQTQAKIKGAINWNKTCSDELNQDFNFVFNPCNPLVQEKGSIKKETFIKCIADLEDLKEQYSDFACSMTVDGNDDRIWTTPESLDHLKTLFLEQIKKIEERQGTDGGENR